MSENKKYTEILGWFGFVTFLCGCVAIALPGNPQSIVVGVGFVIAGAGAAIILIYLARKIKQRFR